MLPALRLVNDRPPQRTELAIAIDEWIVALEDDDYSLLTIGRYRWHAGQLNAWLIERRCLTPGQITERLLREWAISVKQDRGWAAGNRRQTIMAARGFLAWCWQQKLIPANPGGCLKAPIVKAHPRRMLQDIQQWGGGIQLA